MAEATDGLPLLCYICICAVTPHEAFRHLPIEPAPCSNAARCRILREYLPRRSLSESVQGRVPMKFRNDVAREGSDLGAATPEGGNPKIVQWHMLDEKW